MHVTNSRLNRIILTQMLSAAAAAAAAATVGAGAGAAAGLP